MGRGDQMSDLTGRLKDLDGSVTMRDVIVAHVLHHSSTDELADELENRLNGTVTSSDFKDLKNNIIIDELTQRIASIGMLVTTAIMLEEVGRNSFTSTFEYGSIDTYSHITSSQDKF
jgi:hypothetical protein